MNELIYNIAVWVDQESPWSAALHESYYMYNWVESTHVLGLAISLGALFIIDLRMVGYALTNVSAKTIADRLNIPMLIGFAMMFITGFLLLYAVPVRSVQSVWFRIKMVLLVAAAVNAYLFHKEMVASASTWENDPVAPSRLKLGAGLSLLFWSLIVICGRFIAYDWYDCDYEQTAFINFVAGCVDGQEFF